MDKQRMDFLLSMDESEAAFLPLSERHDRIRLFRQMEGMRGLKQVYGSIPTLSEEKTPPRASIAVINLYKK